MEVPFKIRLNSAEESRRVQEFLFTKGVSWSSGKQVVNHTEREYLYITKNKILSYGVNTDTFNRSPETLVTVDELLKSESMETFNVGDWVELTTLNSDAYGKDVWANIGIINLEAKGYKLNTPYKVESILGGEAVRISPVKSSAWAIPNIFFKKTSAPITNPTSGKFQEGDYVIALIDKPSLGNVMKGDVGIIREATHSSSENSTNCRIDFVSQADYAQKIIYSDNHKIARITKEEYEEKVNLYNFFKELGIGTNVEFKSLDTEAFGQDAWKYVGRVTFKDKFNLNKPYKILRRPSRYSATINSDRGESWNVPLQFLKKYVEKAPFEIGDMVELDPLFVEARTNPDFWKGIPGGFFNISFYIKESDKLVVFGVSKLSNDKNNYGINLRIPGTHNTIVVPHNLLRLVSKTDNNPEGYSFIPHKEEIISMRNISPPDEDEDIPNTTIIKMNNLII